MRLLTWKQVRESVVYSRQHWDRLIAQGVAPKPIKLGPHRVAWVQEEIDAWVAERIALRDRQGS